MFKQALQYCRKVTVLMDGFDEICPFHINKAAGILFDLIWTKFRRVLVTLCNVEKERLEKELSGTTFSTKNLSRVSHRECSQPLDI